MAHSIEVLNNKAQQFLRSAAVLFELADYDSCVSRAYFAMLFAAQAALLADGAPGMSGESSLRDEFRHRFIDRGRLPERAVAALNEAAELREMADYAREFVVSEETAERTLQEAEAFVNSLALLVVHST